MKNKTSQARIDANRQNAQKSLGPVTEEGKQKVRYNAIKHGLTGTAVVFADPDEAVRYAQHVESYQEQCQPVGPEEQALVESIADLRWRLSSIPALEQAILATAGIEFIKEHPDLAAPGFRSIIEMKMRRNHEKELRNLHLHENRLARRREREMAELERRQAVRKAKEEEALAEAAKAKLLAQHRNQTLAAVPGVGFVFTEGRFAAYLSRLKPVQREKLLQEALAEAAEEPQTSEAAA